MVTMWPMLLDYSTDECRKILRRLELEAYAAVISVFRAQGELTEEKRKMLDEFSAALSIPIERHRAEIRRAVNDEHLNTIAERVAGPNTTADWAIEGRRVVPLITRAMPQTEYTLMANRAADIQAARNATLPLPGAIGVADGYYSRDEESMDHSDLSRKRAASPSNVIPEKYMAMDHSPINSSLAQHEESIDPITNSSSLVPPCVLQSFPSKDVLLPKNDDVSPKHLVSTCNSLPTKVVTSANTSGSSLLPTKSLALSTSASSLQTTKLTVSNSSNPQPISGESIPVPATSSQCSSVHNSTPGSLHSTAGGLSHTSNAISTPVTSGLIPKTQSKILLTKPLMRPRLFSGNMTSVSQSISYQGSSLQLPSPNLVQPLHKSISPLKPRPPTKIPSTSTASSAVQHPIASVGQRVQSPVTPISRITLSATTVNQTVSSLTLRSSQPTMALTTSTKSSVVPKVLSKPATLRPPPSPRTVLTCVAKAPTLKSSCVAITTAPSRQPVPISVVKTSVPLQLLSTAKSNSSLTYSTKVLLSPSQSKPNPQTVAKSIHYRNEGGLKIISQNLPSSHILPKPSSSLSSQTSSSNPMRVVTTTSPIGTARIVNFSQPFNTRFSRALPSSSSIAAVNLVNSLPVGGLRVALPGSSSMMRAALPAKPNVIVVHKAQVWPQSPGATIVMTSTGSLPRFTTEAIKNKQRTTDRNLPLSLVSENFTSFQKVDADSLVTTKQSTTTVMSTTTGPSKIIEKTVKKDEPTASISNPVFEPPDAAEHLRQRGQLSTEAIDNLQLADLRIDVSDQDV